MKKIKVVMDKYEYGLIINALNDFRTQQIKNGNTVDIVNEVMEKWFKKVK